MSIEQAVRLHVRNCGKCSICEIGEKIGHVPHVICNQARIICLVLEWVAYIAIGIEVTASPRCIEAVAVVLPRNVVRAEHVADAALRGRWNHQTRAGQSFWR